ncbi:hypothetical protein [Sulfuricurvum sp.]|uniref:hypothetical protein n=1 Tax=Sulfuricurvum sp. TaxID=2025608 RepID=UPI00286DB03D|nr:hypothetical protein [Sulfuricurvum sp.]
MKKALRYLIIGSFLYVVFMLYIVSTNKYFSYSEMDINKDGFIHPGELSHYTEVGTRVSCNSYASNSSKEKCIFEVFSLKDGLTLKEFSMDRNSTTYPVPPSQYHYDRR